jgi:dolichyl-diphosphooligosaccharide--protein glycosyltransferase
MGWCFLLVSGNGAWGMLPHLAMAGGIAMAVVGWLLATLVRERGWTVWSWPAVLLGCSALAFAAAWFAAPELVARVHHGFLGAITGGESSLVAETSSLLRMAGRWSPRPLLVELGPAGFVAAPAFVLMGVAAIRERNRALSLVAGIGFAMYGAALLQERMSIYASFHLALAAGWCGWRLFSGRSPRARTLGFAAGVLVFLVPSAAFGIALCSRDNGMSREWRMAMAWLRQETPEPLGDAQAFHRYYPRLATGGWFAYPQGVYGVLAWWDFGYWVLAEGRRPPIANGTQRGAVQAAAFFTSQDLQDAAARLDALGARYVVVDNSMPLIPIGSTGFGAGLFNGMLGWTGGKLGDYAGFYDLPKDGGGSERILIFYPQYYRSMAMRLYLHDGLDYEPHNATNVYAVRETRDGRRFISSQVQFETNE